MITEPKRYAKLAAAHAPATSTLKNCLNAFWGGGLICALAQGLRELFLRVAGLNADDAGALVSITLIFLAAILSGIGVFDRIAKVFGAGTLVPITGFSNAVVSQAIDSRAEGLVLGVGAKIFTVAGPVLLYGTLAGTLYGVVYWIVGLF